MEGGKNPRSKILFVLQSLCLIPLMVRKFFHTSEKRLATVSSNFFSLICSLLSKPLGPSTTLGAHGEATNVVPKVSVFKELLFWHCGQPLTPTPGNTEEAEREAVKAVQRPGSLVGLQTTFEISPGSLVALFVMGMGVFLIRWKGGGETEVGRCIGAVPVAH